MNLNTEYKFHWNDDTLDYFQFQSSYQNREENEKEMREFVEICCTPEDGETDEMLAIDLIKQVYNEKY